jgi:hypothetical protein
LESLSLEDRLEGIEIDNTGLFLDMVRSMLAWEPEKRPTAAALFDHGWLKAQKELRDS